MDLGVGRCLALVGESTTALAALLATVSDEALRRRPRPEVWSPVEYACHVRDVLLTFAVRVHRGVLEDRPVLDPMYADWRAERFGYAATRLDVLLAELSAAAQGFGDEVRTVPGDAWDRTWPAGRRRSGPSGGWSGRRRTSACTTWPTSPRRSALLPRERRVQRLPRLQKGLERRQDAHPTGSRDAGRGPRGALEPVVDHGEQAGASSSGVISQVTRLSVSAASVGS